MKFEHDYCLDAEIDEGGMILEGRTHRTRIFNGEQLSREKRAKIGSPKRGVNDMKLTGAISKYNK